MNKTIVRPGVDSLFEMLVESVKDYAIFMLDTRGYIISWNSGAKKIKGYEASEIIGSHFSRFYTPEDIARGKPEWELKQAIAEGRVEDEAWRLRKDGSRFWADVIITPMRDASGKLCGFAKVTRDLTERKKAEEYLRRKEEELRLLVESVQDYAIFMLDPEGRVVTWNSGAEKIKHYRAEEIIGKSFEIFYTEEDRAAGLPKKILAEARRNGRVRHQGIRVRKDGTRFYGEVVISAVQDEFGVFRGFAKVTRDITEQMKIREIETAKLAAEEAGKAKDHFLAILSHELRTPLTPVLAAVGDLIENARNPPATLGEDLAMIRRNILMEARLIDDLLDLTRISRGKIDLRFETVDAHACLADVLVICQGDILAKGLCVSTRLNAKKFHIWADPTRFRQVIWNVVNNAVKFTPKGGVLDIATFNQGENGLKIEVSDNGIGMSADEMSRIFSAFEQGNHPRRFGGLGLGLSISKSLVELHHGTLTARSAGKGEGAQFEIGLVATEAAVPDKNPNKKGPAPGRSFRILFVDDHDDTRKVLSSLLKKRGHQVSSAASAKEALALLDSESFDLLISDIGLPDASGYDLMRKAKLRQPLKAIALSGYGMDSDMRKSYEAGFEYHLIKPFDFPDLDDIVQKISREGDGMAGPKEFGAA